MKLTNPQFDLIKWFAMILIPALAVLYVAMADVWGLPYREAVVPTVMALDLLVGLFLDFMASQYNETNGLPGYQIKFYDLMKWIAKIGLPAIGACYMTVANIFDWAYGAQVAATVAGLDVFLGVIVEYMSSQHETLGPVRV
jgi:hypothetical protein